MDEVPQPEVVKEDIHVPVCVLSFEQEKEARLFLRLERRMPVQGTNPKGRNPDVYDIIVPLASTSSPARWKKAPLPLPYHLTLPDNPLYFLPISAHVPVKVRKKKRILVRAM